MKTALDELPFSCLIGPVLLNLKSLDSDSLWIKIEAFIEKSDSQTKRYIVSIFVFL